MKNGYQFTFTMYDDCAEIQGILNSEALQILLVLCQNQGFKYLIPGYQGEGLKLVKDVR